MAEPHVVGEPEVEEEEVENTSWIRRGKMTVYRRVDAEETFEDCPKE